MPLSCCQSVFECLGEEDDEDEGNPDAVYPDDFLANELDPDDDVGLYNHYEDGDGFISDEGLADLEHTDSEEEWEEEEWVEGWGPGAANDYQRNLMRFRVMHVSFAMH